MGTIRLEVTNYYKERERELREAGHLGNSNICYYTKSNEQKKKSFWLETYFEMTPESWKELVDRWLADTGSRAFSWFGFGLFFALDMSSWCCYRPRWNFTRFARIRSGFCACLLTSGRFVFFYCLFRCLLWPDRAVFTVMSSFSFFWLLRRMGRNLVCLLTKDFQNPMS